MTTGPDGALWFTDIGANSIGRIDPTTRTLQRFPLTRPASNPMAITVGSDNALWFVEQGYSSIGRIDQRGEIREYSTPWGRFDPYALGEGPDGAVWFPATRGYVGRLTIAGALSLHAVPTTDDRILGIVTGHDGLLWAIGEFGYFRYSANGEVSLFQLPSGLPHSVASCPDGHLWMPSFGPLGTRETYRIFRVATDGDAVEVRIPNPVASQESTPATPMPRLGTIPVRACPGGRCGPGPPPPLTFGVAGCSKASVWFWIGDVRLGRIDTKTLDVVEYGLDQLYPAAAGEPRGDLIWYQDERSGMIYEISVPVDR